MKRIVIFAFLIMQGVCLAQKEYPQNYFRNPLDVPIYLGGSFGELRSNHFHAGLDIKTQGKEGLKVYAAADGYVSRIKVQQFGYGKAIYITHPNGYTTVYGHLNKFNDEIDAYVKEIQYKKENYATGNLYFKEDKFPVIKGDIIAFSGDTGGSGGPHLHFEIRDSETENIINPLFFGFEVKDDIAPIVQAIKGYTLSSDARINQQRKSFQIPIKKVSKGYYIADRIAASGLIGFGISVFDRFNGAPNKNGIYSLEMKVNGKRYYYHDVETFSFSESKFINLHIDYKHFKRYKRKYQRTYKLTPNKLSTYKELINNGRLDVKEGFNYNVEIIAKDFKGNVCTIKIPVAGRTTNAIFDEKPDTTAYYIDSKKFNKFSLKNVTIAFPKNSFYENLYLDFKMENNIVKIHDATVPLDKSFTLTFNVSEYDESEKQHLYIASLAYPKYPRYQFTRKKDSTFFTTSKTLGNYTLLSDKQKPSINLLYFKDQQWITNSKSIKVKINDVGSGIKNWRATIDDEWVLMQYNHKKRILTYNFSDKKLVGSKHIFKLVVQDNVGNTNTLSTTFFKKQLN